jgi:hypothetical protein
MVSDISGMQGLSIFHQDSPDTYTDIADVPTNGGKTSFYVPQAKQFYVVHPKTDVDIAGLLVYRVIRKELPAFQRRKVAELCQRPEIRYG